MHPLMQVDCIQKYKEGVDFHEPFVSVVLGGNIDDVTPGNLHHILANNADKLSNKGQNARVKMITNASIVALHLPDTKSMPIGTEAAYSHAEGCESLVGFIFMIAMKTSTFTFEPNSYPTPGFPCYLIGQHGSIYVRLVHIRALVKNNIPGLPALSSFFGSQCDFQQLAKDAGEIMTILTPGVALWVPFGFIPVLVGLPTDDDDRVSCVMMPFFNDVSASAVAAADKAEIKAFSDLAFRTNEGSKTWKTMSPVKAVTASW